jgi:hypothetical protein
MKLGFWTAPFWQRCFFVPACRGLVTRWAFVELKLRKEAEVGTTFKAVIHVL